MSEAVLLHPENLTRMPVVGARMVADLQRGADEVMSDTEMPNPDISIVIRTRNNARELAGLFTDIDGQTYAGEKQIIVVDTESTDGTTDVARSHGATVVPIQQQGFSYPDALNRGFEAADHGLVVSLVGHSAMVSNVMLKAAARWSKLGNFGGAYGSSLPNSNATLTEWAGAVLLGVPKMLKEPRAVTADALGLMASNCAVVAREAWEELGGYDLRFEAGGEDGELGRQMIDRGISVVLEPLLSMHHTHGLGPWRGFKQFLYWKGLSEPAAFDQQKLWSYRDDLH